MFLSLDLLPLDTAGTSLQGIDNNAVSMESAELHATFSEVMKTPLLVGTPALAGATGEDLPVVGSSLPLAADPELSMEINAELLPDDVEQILAPMAANTGEPVVPHPGQNLQPPFAELDEAKPAIIADVAQQRLIDSERPAVIHELRSGADPFVRPALTSDRMGVQKTELPPNGPLNELDLAKSREPEQPTIQRPIVPISEEVAPRLQKGPVPETATAALPISTGSAEAVEVVQKPVSAPVSTVASAAAIQAPQMQQLAATAAKTPTLMTTTIDVPVLNENWGNALQDRVLWMTTRNIQNAEIRLNPAELGPIRVQVSVQDDAAQLTFTAQHAQTRDALEIALPRLREMLSENGLSLGGATVSDGDSPDVEKDSQSQEAVARESDEFDQDDVSTSDITPLRRIRDSALLDTFA